MGDPHLVNVSAEVKRLSRAVSDAEWDNDPHLEALIKQLQHYQDLEKQGIVVEPKF